VYDEWLALSLTLFSLPTRDVPRVNSLRPPQSTPSFPAMTRFHFSQAQLRTTRSLRANRSSKSPPAAKSTTLQGFFQTRINRYVSGEFAKAIKPLPRQRSFSTQCGESPAGRTARSRRCYPTARFNTGDNVQITKLEFAIIKSSSM